MKEQFIGQASPHEAVARTTAVTGGLNVQASGTVLQATELSFTAQLRDLASQDQVAGHDVTLRDRLVQQSLSTGRFPTATFTADAVTLPDLTVGGPVASVTVPGRLTIHGVTKQVEVAAQVQVAADKATVTGSVPVTMADYGFGPPFAPFVTPDNNAVLEFQLVLARA